MVCDLQRFIFQNENLTVGQNLNYLQLSTVRVKLPLLPAHYLAPRQL